MHPDSLESSVSLNSISSIDRNRSLYQLHPLMSLPIPVFPQSGLFTQSSLYFHLSAFLHGQWLTILSIPIKDAIPILTLHGLLASESLQCAFLQTYMSSLVSLTLDDGSSHLHEWKLPLTVVIDMFALRSCFSLSFLFWDDPQVFQNAPQSIMHNYITPYVF
uniref:Uncharacterized protein n=1 Tax=Moniliophthora roreri TaxID=221103 RepID=A0A0W0FV31_MONRR